MSILISHMLAGQEDCNAPGIEYIVTLPKINKKTNDKIKHSLIADLSPLLIERRFFKDIIETHNNAITKINEYVIQPQ